MLHLSIIFIVRLGVEYRVSKTVYYQTVHASFVSFCIGLLI